ncbi:RNA polymerase sigma factor sigma-70 region 4 domain-containing protein [Sphingomicrobium marinum]|uniref:sigma-70 region 4 domain-containing protein n=1 Tax=Sphingomicrobium marinum TaxID=1227950 RepID=UPI0022409E84|nr:sigma-70 region 4 domain-containing protein [Sphingomicrobium marinum]
MGKRKSQPRDKADLCGGRFIGLPTVVADSPAYVALPPYERAVLLEIMRAFNGHNNGNIVLSYRQIGERLGSVNNRRIAKAMGKLIVHGLIAEPKPQSWTERRAREYRLTFISTHDKRGLPIPATNEYRHWNPCEMKKQGDAMSPEPPPTGDANSPEAKATGDAQTPSAVDFSEFCVEPPNPSGDVETPLIIKPYVVGKCCDQRDPVEMGVGA